MSKSTLKKKNPFRALIEADRGFRFYLVFYVMYTLAFLFGAYLIYNIFHEYGRTFLWIEDGVYQHFPAFHYVCDTVKGILKHDGSLETLLPFNFTLGQGGDILTTLNSYDYTDPISWLCAMVFPLSELRRYALMIFVKLWLCGAAFSVFCFSTDRRNRTAVLCGALTYMFSGAVLHVFARHPNYVNWAYFLPLLLAGVELYRRKGKKYLLILSVTMNLVISFYTFFINAILLAVYVITLSVCNIIKEKNARGKTVKGELWLDVKTALLCFIGAAVVAAVLLPTIFAFLQNPRTGELTGYTDSALQYEVGYYESLFSTLFMPYTTISGYTTYIGLFPVIFVAIGAIFTQKKKHTHLKVLLIVFAVFLCLPIMGRLLNGMGYATSRWAYAVPFLGGVMLVEAFELLPKLSTNVKRWILIAGATYILYCFVRADIKASNMKIAAMVAIGWTLLVFYFITRMNEKVYKWSMVVLVVLTVGFAVSTTFRSGTGDYVSAFRKQSEFSSTYNDSSKALSGKSSPDDFFRVESKELRTNSDGFNKVNSTDMWWSMMPASTYDYYNSFELCSVQQNCNFKGLDDRTALLELASVKYYTANKNDCDLVPFGYTLNKELSTEKYNVYENENALPIAYAIDSYITRDKYDALPAIEKQEALMQAIVLDEPASELTQAQITSECYPLEVSVVEADKIELEETKFTVTGDEGVMTLSADIPENAEIYLRLSGIKIKDPENTMVTVVRENEDLTFSTFKTTRVSNVNYFWPVIRDGVTFNLGIGGAGQNTITVTFAREGKYEYDAIELYALPMENYTDQARKLQKNSLENAYVDAKHITGDITVERDSMLQFAVPYSKGFTAYVDGEKVETVRSDVMYLAVPVSVGSHHVELKYATPYLKEGVMVTLVTICGLVVFEIIRLIVKKARKKK
ncbi:MAG: YfhO family protein [Ruminococcus sp.]|nr:YfhO family protein [Ruminococcus sp.]